MPRQPVDLAQIAVLVHRLRVEVVRGQVVASVHDHAVEVALLARHAVQRLDVEHHRDHRHELVVGVHEQLCPRPLDRHRLHIAAVAREPSVLDDPAAGQELQRPSVGDAVERHRELQVARVDAERRAGDRDALRVTRKLEFRRGRLEPLEHDVAIAQDHDLPVRDAAVHPAGHLQDLVRAEMRR